MHSPLIHCEPHSDYQPIRAWNKAFQLLGTNQTFLSTDEKNLKPRERKGINHGILSKLKTGYESPNSSLVPSYFTTFSFSVVNKGLKSFLYVMVVGGNILGASKVLSKSTSDSTWLLIVCQGVHRHIKLLRTQNSTWEHVYKSNG